MEYREISNPEHFRESRFIKALGGDTPRNRIIDSVIYSDPGYTFSHSDLAPDTDLPPGTLATECQALLRDGLLVADGASYRVNHDHPRVQELNRLYHQFAAENIRRKKDQLPPDGPAAGA